MAVDSPNNQALTLKKRARRRLVGAIALVIFIVIALPKILQDRVALAPQEAIKISMQDEPIKQLNEPVDTNAMPTLPQQDLVANDGLKNTEVSVVPDVSNGTAAEKPKEISLAKEVAVKNEVKDKRQDTKLDIKIEEKKPVDINNEGSFTIQVGVFSDIENVKQLQAKLKQSGLTSKTENVNTPKGQKIRLRAGNFNTRQEAASALTKLQEADLSGMVISNN